MEYTFIPGTCRLGVSDSSGSGQLLTSLGRRKLLRTVAGLGTASLAGCSGTNDNGGPSTTSTAVTETGFTDDSEIDFESFFVVPTYTNSDGSPVDPAVKDIYWATDIQRELYETGGEAGNPPLIIVPDVIDTGNKPSAVGDTDVYAAYIPYGVSVRLRESVTAVDSVRVEAATAMFEDQRYPADDGSTGRAPDTQTHTFSRDELVEGTTVDSRQMQTDGETQDSEQSGASFEFLFEKIPTTNGILLPANIDVSVKFFDSSGELITEKSQRIVATIPNSGAQGVRDLITSPTKSGVSAGVGRQVK